MRDTAPLRAELIKHLEEALALADQIHDPMTGYLVETALDAARAGKWPNYEDGSGGPVRSGGQRRINPGGPRSRRRG